MLPEDGEHLVDCVQSNRWLAAFQLRYEAGANTSQLTKRALCQAGRLATVANVLADVAAGRFDQFGALQFPIGMLLLGKYDYAPFLGSDQAFFIPNGNIESIFTRFLRLWIVL